MSTGISTWKLCLNGSTPKLREIPQASKAASLNAVSRLLPEGVYTTFRTYDGNKILPLEDHIHRLEDSARLLGRPLKLDHAEVKNALHQIRQSGPPSDLRIRLTVDLQERPGTVYLSFEPLRVPTRQEYEHGIRAITCPFEREIPLAKQTDFIATGERLRRDLPPDSDECLMVAEDGRILEGLTSNFFAWKGGELWTAGEGVLAGITRALVLEAAREEGLPIRMESVVLADIPSLQEAFITSSSRSVLPIRQINQDVIGDGIPGPVTGKLAQRYWEKIRQKVTDL